MSARSGRFLLATGLSLAAALGLAQDRAVPRGGGDSGSRGGSDAGARHASPGIQSSAPSSSSSGSSSVTPYAGGSGSSTAERRHPRPHGGGGGGGGGYYPGYPVYPGWGWGGGWYYPGYGGYWWPYGYYGYYGWYGGGYSGYPGGWGGGGTVYYTERREGGSVRVLVDPAEARVYLDGYYTGVVDDFDGLLQRLRVSPGRHEITLKLEGYKSHRMRFYVGPDATVKLYHDMEKGTGETFEDLAGGAPPPEREVRRDEDEERSTTVEQVERERPAAGLGLIQLEVRPDDASVYVDGAFRGSGREATALRLAPGRHRIEVVRPGYRTAESEIEVTAGESTRLTVILERPSS